MKILRVQFKNLNSLRGDDPHEVDFEKEPLRGVTLFAITGPTGAGKSTLLDAITLALYGRAARYGNDPNPEDMMSRHCGECFASVDFEVVTGRFRSEWRLWRARKRASGEFQTPRRQIYNAEGTPLTQNIREADKLIEQIIGLDYGRFLRSVMLAQGEFSRFLKAGPNERAELLECLTGTEIYSDLGALAHEEASRRQTQLTLREQALGTITLLTDDQRREHEESLALRQAQAERMQHEREELYRRIERARQLAAALESERELLREQIALDHHREAAHPDLDRLRAHRRTLPFADALSRLDAATETAQVHGDKLRAAGEEQARANQEHLRTLTAAARFADRLIEREQRHLGEQQRQVEAHEGRCKSLADWLAAHHGDGPALEAALPSLIQSLNELTQQRGESTRSQRRVTQLTNDLAAQTRLIEQTRQVLDEARADAAARHAARDLAEADVQRLSVGGTSEGRRAELDRLRNRLEALRALSVRAGQRLKLDEKLAADQRLSVEAETTLAAATKEATELEARRQEAEQQRVLQEDHWQQSKAWQSYEQQRAKLRAGEPCPLCGAAEHPWAHGYQPAVGLSQIEQALAQTVSRIKALDGKLRTARNAQTAVETRRSLLAEGIVKTGAELALAAREVVRLADGLGVPGDHPDAIDAAAKDAALSQESLGQELTRLLDAEKTLQGRKIECLQADHAVQTATGAEAAAIEQQQTLEASVASESETLRRTNEQLAVAIEAVATQLTPFGASVPELGDELTLIRTMSERQRFFREQAQAHGTAENKLAAAQRDVNACVEALTGMTLRRNELRAGAASAEAPDDTGGKDEANWRGLDDAMAAVQSRQTRAQLADAAAVRQQHEAAEAQEKVRSLTAALESELAGSDFPALANLRAARLDEAIATALDARERELERTANELQGRLATTRGQIESLRAGDATESDLTELESRYDAANHAQQQLLTEIGQRQAELTRDTENRQQHAESTAALAQERERLTVWTRLQALIGSYDGAKFRRYAQGISLDLLVRRANRHLARLNDRYELRRRPGEDLDLDIADHYQAGVTRPLASLSGGESFLSSLALALGLADLAGRNVRIESLFIDEGFGTLDADSLNLAINALDNLRRDRKTVGVISHVELLKERIPTQIVVEKGAGGVSRFVVRS